RTLADAGWCAARWPRGRTSWRRNVLGIFSFNLLFQFGSVLNTSPAVFDFWLCNLRFHSWRRNAGRCLDQFIRCTHYELVALDLRERPGFSRGGQISRSLPLDRQPLNRPGRVRANDVVIRTVIIDHVVLNVDVGHVHRISDVRNILRRRKDSISQDRFTDETHVTKIVILRTDIVFNVHARADWLPFVNDAQPAWRQRRPANVIATGSPRDPGRSPIKIASRKPDPAVIGETRPATIVVGGPAEVFVRDPGPTVVGISPVAVGVWAPVWIAHCDVRLPAVAVAFGLDPVPPGKIIVNEIDRYVRSPRLRKRRHNKSKHA